ncbi:hypothetical protein SY89_01832 [Halolamina pelagica]|uniref:Response regulatory domain-containing protein n=1 Tax=Halolamina pelagica TaxID=699431 RepID=A0A0P7HC58_9EURY|nr:hypothetical protein [Halolamina pelagica]KPN31090.1 hypothetical protein SY89_01832 [Halolamina pelagica]
MQTHPDTVRVLHVDPDSSFVDAAAGRLEREDDRLDVTTATDADEALALLASDAYDCVIELREGDDAREVRVKGLPGASRSWRAFD